MLSAKLKLHFYHTYSLTKGQFQLLYHHLLCHQPSLYTSLFLLWLCWTRVITRVINVRNKMHYIIMTVIYNKSILHNHQRQVCTYDVRDRNLCRKWPRTFSVQCLNSLGTANQHRHHSCIQIYTTPCHQPPKTKVTLHLTYSIHSISHTA